jgi:AraC-like DNA-binding protein
LHFSFRRAFFTPNQVEVVPIFFRPISYSLLFCPLFYLFKKYTYNNTFNKIDLFHFTPYLISSFYYIFFEPDPKSNSYIILFINPINYQPNPIGYYHFLLTIFQGAFYFINSLRLQLKAKPAETPALFSKPFYIHNWLDFNYSVFILITLLYTFLTIFTISDSKSILRIISYYLQYILLSFLMLSYKFFINTIQKKENEIIIEEPKEKYSRTGLKPKDSKKLLDEIKKIMEEKKPYLEDTYRIADLAKSLNSNVNTVSQILNELENKNFYQFINEYRVREVIDKFKNPEFNSHSLLRIAMDSGFNSKSTFNHVFKKMTGMSPNFYRAEIKKSL